MCSSNKEKLCLKEVLEVCDKKKEKKLIFDYVRFFDHGVGPSHPLASF